MAKVWYRVFLKILTFTTLVTSVALIIVSSVTIVSVVKQSYKSSILPESDATQDIADTAGDAVSKITDPDSAHWKKILPKFSAIKGEYKKVVLGSLAAAIAAGILQMFSSLVTLLTCSKDVRRKVSCGVIINVVVFLILLICVIAPLAYDAKEGHRLHFHEIKEKLATDFEKVKMKSFTENLMHELNPYFLAVGLNEAVLLVNIVLLGISYCMKCGEYNYRSI